MRKQRNSYDTLVRILRNSYTSLMQVLEFSHIRVMRILSFEDFLNNFSHKHLGELCSFAQLTQANSMQFTQDSCANSSLVNFQNQTYAKSFDYAKYNGMRNSHESSRWSSSGPCEVL
ncbi:hypothetical protein L6452_40680 [Arctium lappa]|uniref:Uncharacterized protein n=1 Tax=Arctium lappa TaxID=4217 RepID=A0ACB8XN50_ARCLA|nr:hypothetical protein L6452_40680 [Arctium lappa]